MSSRTAVGIVIDTNVLQAVELAAEGERLVLRQAVCEPLPEGAFVDGELANAGAVAETVRRVFRSRGLGRRNVCVALGGRSAIARIIEVSETSEAEAEQTLQDRIARYAIYEGREVLWRASPLETEGDDRRSYLAVAAPADHVRTLLPALRRAGIHVSHLETYALAMVRSLSACAGEDSRPTILLAAHNGAADFLIVKGGLPVLVRSVDEHGGNTIRGPQAMADLLVEAKRSADFCRTRFAGAKPRFWVSGSAGPGGEGADLLTRLRSGLESADVEDLPAWPSLATGVDAAAAGEAWAAIGAAMLGLGRGEAAPLNLVPADWAETERLQKRLLGVVASVGLAILVSVGITSGIRMLVGNTAKQAEAASAEVAVNTEAVKTVGALRRQAAEAAAQVKLWQQVRGQVRPYDWAAGLDAIISQIPEGVRVQQVGFKNGLIRLAGEAQSTDLLHQLVQRLSRLACLEEANLERLIRTPAGGPSPAEGLRPAGGNRLAVYTITCRFREPAAPKPQEPKP